VGTAGQLASVSYLHRSGGSLHGVVAYLMEVQRIGWGRGSDDSRGGCQRVRREVHLHRCATAEGAEIEAAELESQILAAEAELEHWLAKRPESASTLIRHLDAISGLPQDSPLLVLGRALQDVRDRLQWRRDMRQIEVLTRTQVRELERLLRRRRLLRRQLASLALTRRLLANWHAIHIPIGMVLFTAAFIHIGAAIYYATLLK
jgi:hypothetical protein